MEKLKIRNEEIAKNEPNIKSILRFGSAIPINEIFCSEFEALNISKDIQKEIRDKYDKYVNGLANSVKVWLDANKIEDINKADERELFEYLLDVFHKDFSTTYKEGITLTTSIQNNVFNCYSSCIILGNALDKVSKKFKVLALSNHILLRGESYAFETTSDLGKNATYHMKKVNSYYGDLEEKEAEFLLYVTYTWASDILAGKGEFSEAIKYLDKAIGLDPYHISAWNNKGVLLSEIGEYEKALKTFDIALKINPKDNDTYYNIGKVFYKMGQYKEAIQYFEETIAIDPNDAGAWYNKGLALLELKELEEANECFKKAQNLPDYKSD